MNTRTTRKNIMSTTFLYCRSVILYGWVRFPPGSPPSYCIVAYTAGYTRINKRTWTKREKQGGKQNKKRTMKNGISEEQDLNFPGQYDVHVRAIVIIHYIINTSAVAFIIYFCNRLTLLQTSRTFCVTIIGIVRAINLGGCLLIGIVVGLGSGMYHIV